MVPPVRSRAIEKGSWQGRQALTEGLWVSCRNGLPITGDLLLHLTYNPSASHSLSTSPYTGEARGDGRLPARTALPEGTGWCSLPELYDNSTSDSPSTPSSRRLSRVRELIWEI